MRVCKLLQKSYLCKYYRRQNVHFGRNGNEKWPSLFTVALSGSCKHVWCHSRTCAFTQEFRTNMCSATNYWLTHQRVVLKGGRVPLENFLRIHGHFSCLRRTDNRVLVPVKRSYYVFCSIMEAAKTVKKVFTNIFWMSCDVITGIVLGGRFWASKKTTISDSIDSQLGAIYEYRDEEISHTHWVPILKIKTFDFTPRGCVVLCKSCQEPTLRSCHDENLRAKHWARECL